MKYSRTHIGSKSSPWYCQIKMRNFIIIYSALMEWGWLTEWLTDWLAGWLVANEKIIEILFNDIITAGEMYWTRATLQNHAKKSVHDCGCFHLITLFCFLSNFSHIFMIVANVECVCIAPFSSNCSSVCVCLGAFIDCFSFTHHIIRNKVISLNYFCHRII